MSKEANRTDARTDIIVLQSSFATNKMVLVCIYGGDIGLFITPQSLINNVFLFVGLTTLGTLVSFDCLIY